QGGSRTGYRPLSPWKLGRKSEGRLCYVRPRAGCCPAPPCHARPGNHAGHPVSMNIAPEHLTKIQSYGYTRTEAEFLYLVATHSGYFTQRHFLRFAHVESGGAASRFTEKLLQFHHGRTTRYGYHTLIYNLYSRLIYGSIDKDNLRNRRRLSNDLIRTRLLILDFVLDHLEQEYLETETH